MARKIQELLIDDIDGGDADETVRFGLGSSDYEIDLNTSNAKKLRDALKPFIDHARPVRTSRTASRRRGAGEGGLSRQKSKEIRAWAKANNHPVNERGRIPADLIAKYEAAH
ncbi:histone-like nucleoid-structuring protein Lsr2 [Bailinhaonella thermotolerans]|uniref:Lsr2 family protein n=1 Tax=Bailinhaonella thermotolerans TaxID=1070861 RepID=A0A3A4BJ92_9ACTN|nr:Lsr2 family protein [Bailinhaonella thermotolerans]RJL31322.1 Lsr2 family protein [Bailinhaonella thermotolerans]